MSIKAPAPNDVVLQCLDFLTRFGIRCWRNNVGAARLPSGQWVTFGEKGAADVWCLLPAHGDYPAGRLGCFECKSGTGRMTMDQAAWLALMASHGAMCAVVRSTHELEDLLRREGVI